MVELVILRTEPLLKMAPPSLATTIRGAEQTAAESAQSIKPLSAVLFEKVLLTMLIEPLAP